MFGFREKPRFRRLAVVLTAGMFVLTSMPELTMAQEVRQRRTLMDWLFGPQRQRVRQPDVIEIPVRKKQKKKKRSASSVTTITSQTPPVVKNPDARHILVVGDFLAAGLAEGLQDAFAQDQATVIDERSNTASGLVRDDYFDWPGQLPNYLTELKPAVVVLMIGANDRQQMQVNDNKEKFDTPAWNEAYQARVARMIKIAGDAAVPLVWVGLPAFKSTNTSAAALQFNTLYRNEVARVGGEFVDIWDGFVDENGKFITSGSDMNGQPARLRTSDGVGMTAAGKRKMAFYAEKPIRKFLGDPLTVEQLIRLDSDGILGADTETKTAGPLTRTPPINLTDPELDGGGELLGAPGSPRISASVVSHDAKAPPAGRIDDYTMPAL